MSDYEWTDDMDEISGFGGSYEAGCRLMVSTGARWLAEHPELVPAFHGYKGVFGVIEEDNNAAKELSRVMIAAADAAYPDGGVTGAMHHASVQHAMKAHELGWDEYRKQMARDESKEKR